MRPPWSSKWCLLRNLDNGSTIKGEGGVEIGRGGRSSRYWVDEAAKCDQLETSERALSQNTPCIGYVSTPRGIGNHFYRRRMGGKWKVWTAHWTTDPRKGQTWYEQQVEKTDPVTVAQELDIDYTASQEGVVIPAIWVQAALKLRARRGHMVASGLDVADMGADANVQTFRAGPLVYRQDEWRGRADWTVRDTTLHAVRGCEEEGADWLFYDANGIGSSCTGELVALERDDELGFSFRGVVGSDSPSETRYDDDPKRPANERFANLRAELCWALRQRFRRTYQFVAKGIEYPADELISIDPDMDGVDELVAELSSVLYRHNSKGKVQVELKDEMAKRGVRSPNRFDSLIYTFAYPHMVRRRTDRATRKTKSRKRDALNRLNKHFRR